MAGMISGTMFTSISSFLQVIMDPNEYDLLQGRLFASFSNVNSQHLLLAAGIDFNWADWIIAIDSRIECYGLGCSKCKSLGLSVSNDPEELSFLAVFIIGDRYCFSRTIRLLGFVVATIAYQLFPTYKHGTLFVGSALLGFYY